MIDAMILETRFSKDDILEFYVNQVPFASNRKGLSQASKYYFGRSIKTLKYQEKLALLVLIRSPSSYDPLKNKKILGKKVRLLANKLEINEIISDEFENEIYDLRVNSNFGNELYVNMPHFINYIKKEGYLNGLSNNNLITSIDAYLQVKVQKLLEKRLSDLDSYNINNGAVLIVDYKSGEILSWAVAGEISRDVEGSFYDAVTVKRQPGSTLKPFLYATSFDMGLTPNTIVKDEPLYSQVDKGVHKFKNYSKIYYGYVDISSSLGNSLNVPAVKVLKFVGLENFINILRKAGIKNLDNKMNHYGDGIVLGNAEISLYDMVNTYSCLANNGVCVLIKPIINYKSSDYSENENRVFSENSSKAISYILSNDKFRKLEFGTNGVLNFPFKTAVKTGTSANGNDVWTFAYDNKYLVGVWFGNMNRASPNKPINGSTGPALLARSIFNEINKMYGPNPLDVAQVVIENDYNVLKEEIDMIIPSYDMRILYDPFIPEKEQNVGFYISGLNNDNVVLWIVDGVEYKINGNKKMFWNVIKGKHYVEAKVFNKDKIIKLFKKRSFEVVEH